MIAIDTLVHNFLVRTGILQRFDADHPYGAACYRPGGCADIIAARGRSRSTPGSSIRPSRSCFPAVRPARHLAVLRPDLASTSATAIASMIASLATTSIAKFAVIVTVLVLNKSQ